MSVTLWGTYSCFLPQLKHKRIWAYTQLFLLIHDSTQILKTLNWILSGFKRSFCPAFFWVSPTDLQKPSTWITDFVFSCIFLGSLSFSQMFKCCTTQERAEIRPQKLYSMKQSKYNCWGYLGNLGISVIWHTESNQVFSSWRCLTRTRRSVKKGFSCTSLDSVHS